MDNKLRMQPTSYLFFTSILSIRVSEWVISHAYRQSFYVCFDQVPLCLLVCCCRNGKRFVCFD